MIGGWSGNAVAIAGGSVFIDHLVHLRLIGREYPFGAAFFCIDTKVGAITTLKCGRWFAWAARNSH